MATISCARELASFVQQELTELGYTVVGGNETMLGVEGLHGVRDIFKLNLQLRFAHRVLIPVGKGWVRNLDDLYDLAMTVPWEDYLDPDRPFLVNNTTWNETVRDSRMTNLKTKDAIADRMRRHCGRRPDSDREAQGGASIYVYWFEDDCKIYIDTSGRPLSKRGYRQNPWKAPMMESLAAAAIVACGWDMKSPLLVPMCGSGTPAIEAMLMAKNRAPGQFRTFFGFMGLKGWDSMIPGENAGEGSSRKRFGATPEQIWKQVVQQAKSEEREETPLIIASDIENDAVHLAQSNAIAAGVGDLIKFETCDFAQTTLPDEPGVIFFNPEYGERLGEETELGPVYARMGDFLKQYCIGWKAGIFTGNLELAKKIGLRPLRRIPLFNGPIECRLLTYDVYAGSHEPDYDPSLEDDSADEPHVEPSVEAAPAGMPDPEPPVEDEVTGTPLPPQEEITEND